MEGESISGVRAHVVFRRSLISQVSSKYRLEHSDRTSCLLIQERVRLRAKSPFRPTTRLSLFLSCSLKGRSCSHKCIVSCKARSRRNMVAVTKSSYWSVPEKFAGKTLGLIQLEHTLNIPTTCGIRSPLIDRMNILKPLQGTLAESVYMIRVVFGNLGAMLPEVNLHSSCSSHQALSLKTLRISRDFYQPSFHNVPLQPKFHSRPHEIWVTLSARWVPAKLLDIRLIVTTT